MSSTIFCTFEQMDIADLAMGHIRVIPGVRSIKYIVERDHRPQHGGVVNIISPLGVAVISAEGTAGGVRAPSRPVNVKITCDDRACHDVVAALVNQHAHKIVTTP